MRDYTNLKQQVLAYSKQSYEEALFAGTSGNLSVYEPKDEVMIITPSSVPYASMKIDDIIVVKLDGKIVQGQRRPSSEWPMHAEIYKAKKDVLAIVHTHSPYATSFAVSGQNIPVILIEMVPFIGGDIQSAEFSLPGTVDVGIKAIEKLKERNCCLLANHGVVAVGKNLDEAHIRAVYAEDAAKIYSLAINNGNVTVIEDKYVKMMLEKYNKK